MIIILQIPMGAGIAISIRVGQYLGAGDSIGAQSAGRVAFTIICKKSVLFMNTFYQQTVEQ